MESQPLYTFSRSVLQATTLYFLVSLEECSSWLWRPSTIKVKYIKSSNRWEDLETRIWVEFRIFFFPSKASNQSRGKSLHVIYTWAGMCESRGLLIYSRRASSEYSWKFRLCRNLLEGSFLSSCCLLLSNNHKWQGQVLANYEFLWDSERRKSLFLPSYRDSSSPGHLEILESQWLPLIQVSLEGQGGREAQGAHLTQAVLCAIQVLHLFQDLLFPLASLGFLYHLLRSEVLQIPWLKS